MKAKFGSAKLALVHTLRQVSPDGRFFYALGLACDWATRRPAAICGGLHRSGIFNSNEQRILPSALSANAFILAGILPSYVRNVTEAHLPIVDDAGRIIWQLPGTPFRAY